jgi:hypothetical protein
MSYVSLNKKQREYLKQIYEYLETIKVPDTHLRVHEIDRDRLKNETNFNEIVEYGEYVYDMATTKYAILEALRMDSYSTRDSDFFNSLKPIYRMLKHSEENRRLIEPQFGDN